MLLETVNLRKNIAFVRPGSSGDKDIEEILSEIKDLISSKDCRDNIILDLSEQNFLDGINIAVLAATYHFVEFLSGKIYIVVPDRQSKKLIELFNLSNAVVIYNENQLSLDKIA